MAVLAELLDPTVIGLFEDCCPAAVAWLVIPVVVDSVQAQVRGRAWTNVGIEGLEALPPRLADRDSPTAVAVIARIVRVMAPLQHLRPDHILRQLVDALTRRADATKRFNGPPTGSA